MLGRDFLIIGLSPTCLRIAAVSGKQIEKTYCAPLEAGEWDQVWEKSLSPLTDRLKAGLREVGAKPGAAARVVYFSPSAIAEVFSPPTKGNAALQAAELSLGEAIPSRQTGWCSAFNVLHRDRVGGNLSKTHVLSMAESPETAGMIERWLSLAGVRMDSLVSTKAGAIARAAALATQLPTPGTHAVLWVDDHVTVFAGWTDGRLSFIRAVDFGCWMFAEAFLRGAKVASGAPMDQAGAYRLLFSMGIPARGQGGESGVNVEGAMPLIQPVIQRYAIETRQTIRFGVAEADRAKVNLMLAGPGSRIPNLAKALETHCDLPFEVHSGDEDNTQAWDFQSGEAASAVRDPLTHTLTPPAEAARRMNRRLNGAVRVGAVAACLCLAAAFGWAYMNSAKVQQAQAQLEPQLDAMKEHDVERARAERLAGDLGSANKAIVDLVGARPNWLSALALVSRCGGDLIELNQIAGGYPPETGKDPTLTLTGTAYPPRGKDARADSLVDFVARLAKSPIVSSVKIVSTHASEVAGTQAKSFIVSVKLKSIAAEATLTTVVQGSMPADSAAQVPENNQ